jgi:hypothetical protein
LNDDSTGDAMHADDETVALKLRCVDLLFGCPRQRCDDNCPFAKARTQDIVERVGWLKQRSVTELRELLAHHALCSESPQCKPIHVDRVPGPWPPWGG